MTGHACAGAVARKALWRTVLTLTGGLRVDGAAALPSGPCVIVANHRSHADTAALIAALPARRRPAVAAAADYWFRGGLRPGICLVLCAAFPVRRTGGGSADLAAAARLLATGRDVIVFPEGTRSRDGHTGDFHRGAARLAAAAGVPIVPAGISGTGTLLPPDGAARRPRRTAVIVRIGAPFCVMELTERLVRTDGADGDGLTDATAEAHARVVALVADQQNSRPAEQRRLARTVPCASVTRRLRRHGSSRSKDRLTTAPTTEASVPRPVPAIVGVDELYRLKTRPIQLGGDVQMGRRLGDRDDLEQRTARQRYPLARWRRVRVHQVRRDVVQQVSGALLRKSGHDEFGVAVIGQPDRVRVRRPIPVPLHADDDPAVLVDLFAYVLKMLAPAGSRVITYPAHVLTSSV